MTPAPQPSPRAAPLDRLLAERTWVAALARRLVRDPGAADDAVQDVYLAALRSPPDEPSRGWLATVLRNAVRMRARGEARRESRETAATAGDGDRSSPSSHEIVARAEEHRRVVDAVLTLEEPYRTTVLLRFFDDLPPAEVARRTGVPLETARARIRRAQDLLRVKLDALHGGDGIAWKAALVPLAFHDLPLPASLGGSATAASAASNAGASASASVLKGVLLMGAGKTAVVGVVALVAGGAIGWLVSAPKVEEAQKRVAALEPVVKERDDAKEAVSNLRSETQRAHDEVQRLAARDRELSAQVRDLQTALDAAKADLAKAKAPAAGAAGAAAEARKQRLSHPAFDDVLGKVDWNGVSEHIGAMTKVLSDLGVALSEGKSPDELPPETSESITKHNGPLVTVAVRLMQAKVPGTGANGSFTHPAFMSNAIIAVLEGAGKPLSDDQMTRISEISKRYVAEDAARLSRYDDATFQIRKVEEEGDLRERFFQEARGVLTAEQVELVSPAATRDRLQFDLFSAGILMYTVTRPVPYTTPAKFAEDVAKSLGGPLRLSDEQKTKLAVIAAEWTAALPGDITRPSENPFDKAGMLPTRNSLISATETRKLLERVARDLELQGDSLTGARRWGVVLMPQPNTRGGEGEDE